MNTRFHFGEQEELAEPSAEPRHRSFLELIDEHNLTRLEIKAIFAILFRMTTMNEPVASQSDIMRRLGSDPSNASKVFKKLRDAGILFKENGQNFVSPHVWRAAEEMAETMMSYAKQAKKTA